MLEDESLETIDVCICTFRRTSVAQTIASVAAQTYGAGNIRVVVADNDETTSARERVEAACRSHGLAYAYVHAPKENISIARNACVDAVTASRFAFIDDDEVAEPDWLRRLAEAMDRTGADVVFGPVDAVYPEGAPPWWRGSGLHDTRPSILKDGSIITGYTCNVLVRTGSLGGLRFRLDYGKSGGEDTLFFHDLHCLGARFGYAPEALVKEGVAPNRLRMRWLLARTFLGGQLHMSMLILDHAKIIPVLALSASKIVFSLAGAAVNLLRPAALRRHLMRASLHVGVLARTLGYREILRKNA